MKKSFLLLALAAFLASYSYGQAPQKFNYQGIARNSSGAPLSSATLGLRISILDGSALGPTVFQETHSVTTNAYGLYNVAIGTGSPVTGSIGSVTWAGGDKYVKVEIDPAGGSSYVNLGETQLLSVPYALFAANSAAGAPGPMGPAGPAGPAGPTGPAGPAGSGSLSGTTNRVVKFTSTSAGGNSQITDDGTTVSINTSSPSSAVKLQVTGSSITNAIKGTLGSPSSVVTSSAAVYGESSSGEGIAGISTSSNGIFGVSTATSGTRAGVFGQHGSSGYGIWGLTSTGVAGYFDGSSSGGYGVIVPNGRSGFGTTTPGAKVGITTSADSFALLIESSYTGSTSSGLVRVVNNSSTTNNPVGVFSEVIPSFSSKLGQGVIGIGGNVGVYGEGVTTSTSSTGETFGVFGGAYTNSTSIGVFGRGDAFTSTGVGTKYGVYGTAANGLTNIAGYFSGNVQITGSISKGSGTFKIDHPLDPDNKYLYHSFVESPDMMNIYNGNITTDAAGFATVEMPSYFDALNKDFRYQLTVIGTFAQAIVKEKMSGSKFVIQTNQPNVEVSWMVTGVRKDKYAEAHRVVAEVEKENENKGKYLHPIELGKPETTQINYQLEHNNIQKTKINK